MRKIVATVAGLILGAALAAPAHATDSPAVECPGVTGWYVNPDELDRKPEPTKDGMVFTGDALIHHATSLAVADLKPGTFDLATGSDSPDQPSFFSVEVRNNDGTGYATLRWNLLSGKWNMVTGGQFYENADPAALVKMPPVAKSGKLISFGVGYTKNPPGTKVATVSSVTFAGKTHDLKCQQPEPTKTSNSPSPSPSVSTSATASPSVPATSSPAPGGVAAGEDEPSLPITGAPVHLIVAGAAALIGAGLLALGITHLRRRNRFTV